MTDSESLFSTKSTASAKTFSRFKIPRAIINYSPTFLDTSTVDPAIKAACNNQLPCMIDAAISGVPSIGKDTSSGLESNSKSVSETSKSPPLIMFESKL